VAISADERSITTLLSDAMAQLSTLFRTELRLARTEVTSGLSRGAVGIGLMGGAVLIGVAVLVVLLLAIADWATQLGLPRPLADLVACAVGIIVAGALFWTGRARIAGSSLVPKRAVDQVQRDASVIKEHVA
jgi:hypothetical protein